ncbi:MAG: Gfo/Idh/MocA family oxidoreductase [Christensenellaceae bacterium]|jgi:predicted dehydrogenase|nr:Gfo/Idh/MocA family oxidoreductase [Christensenellaceae bacterium]
MIKMGIVGAGLWAQQHAKLFQEIPDVECVAICDVNEAKAKEFAAQFQIPKIYTSHKELLEKSGCDALSIVTPDFLHTEIVVDAANAGMDMLIEKPLATEKEDVYRIVEAVRKSKVRVMVDMHNRFSPPFNNAKSILDSGCFGKAINAYFRLNDVRSVATDMLKWASKSSILWFLGSHSLDTLNWLLNSRPKEVFARSSRGVLDAAGVDAVDVYQASLLYENGVIAQMENGWITPNGNPCVNDIKFNVVCECGKLDIDASNNTLLKVTSDTRMDTGDCIVANQVFGSMKGFAYESIRSFLEKLKSGEDFYVSLEDSANVVLALLNIMESAVTGKIITCDYI